MSDRAGLKWVKIKRFFSLMTQPELSTPWLQFSRFEEVPVERLQRDGIRGVLIDADGTLGPHHATEYSSSVVEHVRLMRESGLKVAIYTNDSEDRFNQFTGIPVVSDVPPKPDPAGFLQAMARFLELADSSQVCMIGDNYITDGGAIEAGMRFIHITPLPGSENFFHKWTRDLACRQVSTPKKP